MKKLFALSLAVLLALSLCACGGSAAPAATAVPVSPAPAVQASAGTDGIDVDLTQLSSTMVYSEVYNMMYESEQYLGKVVKMTGLLSVYEDGSTGNRYFTCVIQDATACCAQGLEFDLGDGYSYPEDYPEPGTEITVTGVFDTYEEEYNGSTYSYLILRDAVLV